MRSPIRTSAASTRGSTSRMRTRSWTGGCPREAPRTRRPASTRLAALAIRLGEALGMDTPEQLAQLLNALCRRRQRRARAGARAAAPSGAPARAAGARSPSSPAVPVVLKTGAMFHPQPLAMLLSLLAFTATAWMIARRDYRLRALGRARPLARRRPARPLRLALGRRRRPRRARGGGGRAARAPAADRHGARGLRARDRAAAAPLVPPQSVDGRRRDLRARMLARLARELRGRPSSTSTPACRT